VESAECADILSVGEGASSFDGDTRILEIASPTMIDSILRPTVLIEPTDHWDFQALQGIALIQGFERGLRWLRPGQLTGSGGEGVSVWRANGIIVDRRSHDLIEQHFASTGPVIVISSREFDLPRRSVAASRWRCFLDRRTAFRQAVDILSDQGFREFAWVSNARRSDSTERELFTVLAEMKVSVRRQLRCEPRRDAPWKVLNAGALDQWLVELPRLTAVLTHDCQVGLWVLDSCRRVERDVPAELAVFSAEDDDVQGDFCQPSLSRISASAARVGQTAGALLQRILAGDLPSQSAVLVAPEPPKLRCSTETLAIDDTAVAAAVNFIRANAHLGIRVPDVVRHLSISRRSLEQKFRAALQRSPAEEIRRCRVSTARELLEQSSDSIAKIAQHAGFESCELMSRTFRKLIGVPPTEYRRQQNSLAESMTVPSPQPHRLSNQIPPHFRDLDG